jgi:hypothetical protein
MEFYGEAFAMKDVIKPQNQCRTALAGNGN